MPFPKSFPVLRAERLRLRQPQARDLQQIYEGLSDLRVIRYYGVNFSSLESTQEQLDFYQRLWTERSGIFWVVEEQDRRFVGNVGFYAYEAAHSKAELGCWILPSYWKMGYGREALMCVQQYLLDKLGLQRIEGNVEAGNQASLRMLESLGWTHEGTLRRAEWKNGQFIDLHLYSLLRHEFVSFLPKGR